MSPKVYEGAGAHNSDPGWTFSWSFMVISYRIDPKSLLGGFWSILYTNIITPRVSEATGAQVGPLLLKFHVDFIQNRSEIVSRGIFEDAILSNSRYSNETKILVILLVEKGFLSLLLSFQNGS